MMEATSPLSPQERLAGNLSSITTPPQQHHNISNTTFLSSSSSQCTNQNQWAAMAVSEPVTNQQLIMQSAIFLIPIALHIVGIRLLYVTRHAQQRCTQFQRIYLVNLSVIEILRGTLKVLYHLLLVGRSNPQIEQAAFYLWLIQTSGAFLWYILVLVLITFDRFLEVFLNLKYRLYCSLRRTVIALFVSFTLSFTMSLVFCVCYKDFNSVYHVFPLYVWPVTELTFLLVALFTYSYLFAQIRANRRKTEQMLHNFHHLRNNSMHHIIQSMSIQRHHTPSKSLSFHHTPPALKYHRIRKMKQRLYLPSFLILAFVLLWILPDTMVVVHILRNTPIPRAATLAVNMCYALAMSADVLIYVFSMVAVRRHLMKNFYRFLG